MTPCIESTARKKTQAGYRRIVRDGKIVMHHRAVYEETHGPIPEGLLVMHMCDNPPCINPDHLRVGTHADNMLDKKLKGRASRLTGLFGEANKISRLTDAQCTEMRRLYAEGGHTYKSLAAQFDCAQMTAWRIVKRKVRNYTGTHQNKVWVP